jgi:hypothetical protein
MQMCSETAYRKLYAKQNVSHRNTLIFILVKNVQKLHIQNYVKKSVLREHTLRNIWGVLLIFSFAVC